ncbi:MAG: DUF4837 family protein [Calditrichia bacterium]
MWALNQYVVFLVAPDKEAMIQRLYDLGELVYDDFEKSYYQRLKKQMFERGEDDKLGEYISNNFRLLCAFSTITNWLTNQESEHLWLRRIYPDRDRSLTVRWIPDADSITSSPSWLIKKRNNWQRKSIPVMWSLNRDHCRASALSKWPGNALGRPGKIPSDISADRSEPSLSRILRAKQFSSSIFLFQGVR